MHVYFYSDVACSAASGKGYLYVGYIEFAGEGVYCLSDDLIRGDFNVNTKASVMLDEFIFQLV